MTPELNVVKANSKVSGTKAVFVMELRSTPLEKFTVKICRERVANLQILRIKFTFLTVFLGRCSFRVCSVKLKHVSTHINERKFYWTFYYSKNINFKKESQIITYHKE